MESSRLDHRHRSLTPMPPRPIQEDLTVVPRTWGVKPRCIQTSGSECSGWQPSTPLITIQPWTAVFKLPLELIVEALSNFGDPHLNIRCEIARRGGVLVREHVERLTVTRKLTMTCWHLCNMLFPLLWAYVEGCNLSDRHHFYGAAPPKNGLYAQCSYLALNPAIAVYVRYVYSCAHSDKN